MFAYATSIDVASADDGFSIISVTYANGLTVAFVTPAKEQR
jgi:hypothetical protein